MGTCLSTNCGSLGGPPSLTARTVPRGERVAYIAACYSRGGLVNVRANVARHGGVEACTFVPGYFHDTPERAVTMAAVDDAARGVN